MLRLFSKWIIHHTYRPLLLWYLKKNRIYKYNDITIEIHHGVFHPGLFFSTKLLLEFLKKEDLKNRNILELGCGAGLISIYAAKQGARVTASDISLLAVENTKINTELNDCNIDVYQSDLFQSLPSKSFDFIIINPPYYPRDPSNIKERAWYCGTDHIYFKDLFSSLRSVESKNIIMILSDDCDISKIKSIAFQNYLQLEEVYQKKIWFERNLIYKICKRANTKF